MDIVESVHAFRSELINSKNRREESSSTNSARLWVCTTAPSSSDTNIWDVVCHMAHFNIEDQEMTLSTRLKKRDLMHYISISGGSMLGKKTHTVWMDQSLLVAGFRALSQWCMILIVELLGVDINGRRGKRWQWATSLGSISRLVVGKGRIHTMRAMGGNNIGAIHADSSIVRVRVSEVLRRYKAMGTGTPCIWAIYLSWNRLVVVLRVVISRE